VKGVGVVGWLVILAIAFLLLPQLLSSFFGGVGGLLTSSQRAAITNDPFGTADAILSEDLRRMSGYGAR
jgi:hypothetical protein